MRPFRLDPSYLLLGYFGVALLPHHARRAHAHGSLPHGRERARHEAHGLPRAWRLAQSTWPGRSQQGLPLRPSGRAPYCTCRSSSRALTPWRSPSGRLTDEKDRSPGLGFAHVHGLGLARQGYGSSGGKRYSSCKSARSTNACSPLHIYGR